jgi:hypothetical protein
MYMCFLSRPAQADGECVAAPRAHTHREQSRVRSALHTFVDYGREVGNWGEFCRPNGANDFECTQGPPATSDAGERNSRMASRFAENGGWPRGAPDSGASADE